MTTLRLKPSESDDPIEVRLTSPDDEHVRIDVDGRHLEAAVSWSGPGSGHLMVGGRVVPFAFARTGETIHLWHDGRQRRFEIVPRTAQRAAGGIASGTTGDLKAPMPGKILEIRHDAGATFEAHDAIIVMESMKMEMTLSVPSGGRVREILCKKGELVEMGELLARLEPEAASS